MPRARQGSAYVLRGKVVVQVRLRADAPKRFWIEECPPRSGGVPVDVVYARSVAADLQRLYDAGQWDPLAPKVEAAAPPPEAPKPPPTVRAHADAWLAAQTYESAPKDRKVLAKYLADDELGRMAVPDVRPKHIAAFLLRLEAWESPRGGTIAARTVRNVYDALRRSLDHAVLEELIAANPCAPVRGKLPTIEDKDPSARDGWFFKRAEVWQLVTDPRVIEPRRVVYAIEFWTGCRPGELAALRVSDWDRDQRPLTRLTFTRAIKSVSKKEGRTKTGARKWAPVHPALERVLTEWLAGGWRRLIGRDPQPGDLLVPNQLGTPRDTNRANRDFGRDLAKLGLRDRHHYCTRHTFITQTQEDGGDPSVLRWITHAPPKTAYDGYTRAQWSRLCAEIAKLSVGPDEAPADGPGGGGGGLTSRLTSKVDGEESNGPESPAENRVGARGFEPSREGHEASHGVANGRNPVDFDGDGATGGDTWGRLTSRSTSKEVIGPHAGEALAYAVLERAEADGVALELPLARTAAGPS